MSNKFNSWAAMEPGSRFAQSDSTSMNGAESVVLTTGTRWLCR